MPKSMCKFDFKDVRPAFSKFNRQVRKKVEEIGQEAVEYAIEMAITMMSPARPAQAIITKLMTTII